MYKSTQKTPNALDKKKLEKRLLAKVANLDKSLLFRD
jgi:hypothetical protein